MAGLAGSPRDPAKPPKSEVSEPSQGGSGTSVLRGILKPGSREPGSPKMPNWGVVYPPFWLSAHYRPGGPMGPIPGPSLFEGPGIGPKDPILKWGVCFGGPQFWGPQFWRLLATSKTEVPKSEVQKNAHPALRWGPDKDPIRSPILRIAFETPSEGGPQKKASS